MQQDISVDQAFQIFENAIDAMIAKRPKKEEPKGLFQRWQKSPNEYIDDALAACKVLCTESPGLLKDYNQSQGGSQFGFALTHAGQIARLSSSLNTLDPKSWVPKVTDDNTMQLAIAFETFLDQFMIANMNKTIFTSERQHSDINYQLLDRLPSDRNIEAGRIYLSANKKGTYDFKYVSENDGKVLTGSFRASRLDKYQDFMKNADTFTQHISDAPKGTQVSLSDKIYTITGYPQNCPSHSVQKQLFTMLTEVQENIKGQTVESPVPNK